MLSTNLSANILASLLLFSTQTPSTFAAPTRTHCQCKIVSNTASSSSPPPSLYTPSAAHWTPASPSEDEDDSPSLRPIPVSIDVCATLGSELEKFRHTEPELYDLYMRGASTHDTPDRAAAAQKPIPTSVLLSGNREAMHDYAASPPESNESKAQNSRIVCFSEPQTLSSSSSLHDFQSSPLGLWALQVIVMFSIVACVVEGVHMLRNCIQKYTCDYTSDSLPSSPLPPSKGLRLTGAEQRLLAIPDAYACPEDAVCSPGAEKKLRAYEAAVSTRHFFYQGRSGRREFIAYDDDSDDEVNRPVM